MERHPHHSAGRQNPAGLVSILPHCGPETVRRFDFDAFFGVNARSKSIFARRETLETRAADPETNVVLAVTEKQEIAGFGVLAPPDADDRWSRLQVGTIMEVEVMEVHSRFRASCVGGEMLRLMLAHPRIERMIVFMVGYTWTWDLAGAGLDAGDYREMLMRLFRPFGFQVYKTNEPNVCLDPHNLFMARIGSDVPDDGREDFKYLRFGVPPRNR